MRQGSVQPLSVTTGLEGRPELGTRGAMVSALVWNTGSGRAAIATLLTLAAATAPPAMPANRKKSLLEFMMVFFGDGFSQRDPLVAVGARDFIRRAVRGIALAKVRACRATCGLQAVGSGQGLRGPGIAPHDT